MGRYDIVRPIGEGGMAEVYLCVRRGAGGFEKKVVLKVLHSKFLGDEEYLDMFLEEAKLLARLQHPNIVTVFEVECVEGVPYLAMEYVNGPTLGRLHRRAARSGKNELGYMLHILRQTCLGLHHAHGLHINGVSVGLVHRDVSSQNILIDAETGTAKLIDFGIARVDESQQKTEVGVLKGKMEYMAPETLQGVRPDARADLYAVGVLLYRVVTDRAPFGEVGDAWSGRIAGRYAKPSEVKPGVSAELDAIVDKALQPDPARRYQSAAELAADLEREIDRLGVDLSRLPQWLRDVFPGGEDEWSKRFDAAPYSAAHSVLNQAMHERTATSMSAAVASPPPAGNRSALIGGAAMLAIALLVGGALWLRPALLPQVAAVSRAEDVVTYLDSADALLAKGQFDAALAMNRRAEAVGTSDAPLIVRMAHQKSDIQRKQALVHARAQINAGQLDGARATLSDAMRVSPSDEEIASLFAEIGALAPPPVAAPVVPAAVAEVVPPPEPPRARPQPARPARPAPRPPSAPAPAVALVETAPPIVAAPTVVVEAAPAEAVPAPVAPPAPPPIVASAPPPAPAPKGVEVELPGPSSAQTVYAFHAALAPVLQALVDAGTEPTLARGILLDLESFNAPALEAGQVLEVSPRPIYEFVLAKVQADVPRRDIEASLRKAYRSGALD